MDKEKFTIKRGKYEYKLGTYGDFITYNGRELTREEIIDKLNENEQLMLGGVSCSDLLSKAKQFQKENEFMINGAKGHESLAYYKGISIGIDRIIKLIKRHCN